MDNTSALSDSAFVQAMREVGDNPIDSGPMAISSADASAIKHTVSTIKMLAPIQQIAAYEQGVGESTEDVLNTCKAVLATVRTTAYKISENVTESSAVKYWLKGYAAGVVAEAIAKSWPQDRASALNKDWSIALSQITTPMIQSYLPSSWNGTDRSISVSASMMSAVNDVMDVQHQKPINKNALGHKWVLHLLLKKSTENVENLSEKYSLSDDDKESLLQSFVKQGGSILCRCWESYADRCRSVFDNDMSTEQREIVKRFGFPLSALEKNFNTQMDMMCNIAEQAFALTGKTKNAESSESPVENFGMM